MTPDVVTEALRLLQSGSAVITINKRKFHNEQGVLVPA
jgi:hypothetical protein